MIKTSHLKYLFFLAFPWFLLSSGGFIHLDMNIQGLMVLLMVLYSVFYIAKIFTKRLPVNLNLAYKEKSIFETRAYFVISFFILSFLLYRIYNFSKGYGFNLAYSRFAIFNDEDGVRNVYGSVLYRMIYIYMYLPTVFLFLLDVSKFKKQHYILSIIYILTGVFLGGRFALYHVFVIYLINNMFVNSKIISLKNFLIALVLFVISLGVIINRKVMSGDIMDVYSSINLIFEGIYNYHSIQLGIMSFYHEMPVTPLGPFTGLTTPVGFIIDGGGTIEGKIMTFLDSIEFTLPNSIKDYNAFGTSIIYFLPLFGWFGILAFFASVLVSFFLVSLVKNDRTRILLFKYMLFSFFFSAFSPMMFGFAWWFAIIFIVFFYSRILNKKQC